MSSSNTVEIPDRTGWNWLINATKWHYFVNGTSLCGRYFTFARDGYQEGNDNSPDNCATCVKRKKARDAKVAR